MCLVFEQTLCRFELERKLLVSTKRAIVLAAEFAEKAVVPTPTELKRGTTVFERNIRAKGGFCKEIVCERVSLGVI